MNKIWIITRLYVPTNPNEQPFVDLFVGKTELDALKKATMPMQDTWNEAWHEEDDLNVKFKNPEDISLKELFNWYTSRFEEDEIWKIEEYSINE